MVPKSTPTKPNNGKEQPSDISNDVGPTNPDLATEHVSSQGGSDHKASSITKNYAWSALGWILAFSIVLIVVGLIIQDINQPSDIIRWLIYRRGYPYFQAVSFSILVVTSAVVLRNWIMKLLKGEKAPYLVDIFLKLLPYISPQQKNSIVWIILLGFSFVFFISSFFFPRCFAPDVILVSFDIYDNGNLIVHLSPGETVFYNPGSYIDIEAKLEARMFNLPPPNISCGWATYTGDGRLIQGTNCKINYQTGRDGNPDPVVVMVTQKGCAASLGYYSFFISSTP